MDNGGRELMKSVGDAVRANPIPVLLIGAGIAWLLTAGGGARNRYIEEEDTSGGVPTAAGRRRGRARRQVDWDEDPELAELESAARRGRRGRFARAEDAFGEAVHEAEDAASGLAGRARDWGSRAERAGAEAWDAATDTGARLGSEAASAASRAATAVGSTAAHLAGQASAAVGQAASAAYDTVAGAAGQAASTVGQAAYSAGRSAGDAAFAYGRSAAERAIDSVEDAWHYGQRNLGGVVEQQPLVAGAIGLAIGAALGAAIPSTEAEHRLMGERADELKKRARDFAAEQYERSKEAATQVYEDVRDEIETQNLAAVPGEIVGEVAERVKAVAETARSATKEGAEEALGGGKAQADRKPTVANTAAKPVGTAKAS
jgi:hypothetical protein